MGVHKGPLGLRNNIQRKQQAWVRMNEISLEQIG
jgi:hypothetical protein